MELGAATPGLGQILLDSKFERIDHPWKLRKKIGFCPQPAKGASSRRKRLDLRNYVRVTLPQRRKETPEVGMTDFAGILE